MVEVIDVLGRDRYRRRTLRIGKGDLREDHHAPSSDACLGYVEPVKGVLSGQNYLFIVSQDGRENLPPCPDFPQVESASRLVSLASFASLSP